MLPSVVDTRPPHHAVRREPVDQSKARGPPRRGTHSTTHGLTGSRVPATGPRRSGTGPSRPELARLPPSSADHAAAASRPKRNSLPSTQRRWRTVASLRASATLARRAPRRLATSSPHRFRVENLPALVSITFAGWYGAVRTVASPALLMPPVTSVSPDRYRLGVSPKCAPTALAVRNRPGSSTAVLKVTATSAPTPGAVISRRQTASPRTMVSIRRCRRMNSACRPSRACNIAPTTASSISWPAISSLILAANRPLLTSPTLSAKPRKIPRMLSSTSRSLACSSLRPTSSARTSRAGGDLRCTGRYHPIRKSWARPRASLRSVFTTIADSAAFTCRVSSNTASRPASVRPACNHCDKGPASSPTRVNDRPSRRKKSTSASGSLATFASGMIRPVAPTTHTLLRSSETSIPALALAQDNPAVVLGPAEQVLHPVPFPVGGAVVPDRGLAVPLRRDHRLGPEFLGPVTQLVRIVPAVANQALE